MACTGQLASHVTSHVTSYIPAPCGGASGGGSGGSGSAELGVYATRGLVGVNNTSVPNTQYDLSAAAVQLRNPSDDTVVVRTSTGTLTNNVGTAGPAANGRDQAGAFSANSWVHFYFIWNGTALATLSSAVAPPTGPTLPSGYTHWAYAGAVRFNASSQLLPVKMSGARAFYDITNAGVNRVLNGGTSTSMTAVDCSGFVPPNTQSGMFNSQVFVTGDTLNAFITLYVRVTGSTISGFAAAQVLILSTGGFTTNINHTQLFVSSSQSVDYFLDRSAGTVSGGGGYIDVLGYVMPNGDS